MSLDEKKLNAWFRVTSCIQNDLWVLKFFRAGDVSFLLACTGIVQLVSGYLKLNFYVNLEIDLWIYWIYWLDWVTIVPRWNDVLFLLDHLLAFKVLKEHVQMQGDNTFSVVVYERGRKGCCLIPKLAIHPCWHAAHCNRTSQTITDRQIFAFLTWKVKVIECKLSISLFMWESLHSISWNSPFNILQLLRKRYCVCSKASKPPARCSSGVGEKFA